MLGIERFVDRIDQKRRMHDLSAKVVLDVERLETQQAQIIGCTVENKELMEYIQSGIRDNVLIIKNNIEFLKKQS